MLIDRLLRNPHYYSGALLAKALTCIGSIVWGLSVVSGPSALTGTAYAMMIQAIPEDYYGWFFLLVSGSLMTRLYAWSPPHWLGQIGYFALALFWLFVWLAQIVVWVNQLVDPQGHAVYPTATAGATVMGILSVCAFASNPRSSDAAPAV